MSKEELERKWHKLIKLLHRKDILTCDEQESLEFESYLERKREEWWNN